LEAIRKITTIHNGSIKFKELEVLNEHKVEVIVLSLNDIKKTKLEEQKKNFFKFKGHLKSNFSDTSENIDDLVYGQ